MYVAIGYGLANSIMIGKFYQPKEIMTENFKRFLYFFYILEGDDGVIIIDTLESCEVAR